MYRGEVQPLHPAFPPSSKVTVALPPQTPVPVDAPDFAYTDEEDRLIDEFVGKIGALKRVCSSGFQLTVCVFCSFYDMAQYVDMCNEAPCSGRGSRR